MRFCTRDINKIKLTSRDRHLSSVESISNVQCVRGLHVRFVFALCELASPCLLKDLYCIFNHGFIFFNLFVFDIYTFSF